MCVPLAQFHMRARLYWSREHHSWTEKDWRHVLFSDESKFNTQNDSRRVFAWREPGKRYNLANIREIYRFDGTCILGWAGIKLDGHTLLYIISDSTMTAERYRNEVLEPYVRFFRGTVGDQFVFMDDNAQPHTTVLVDIYLEEEGIHRTVLPQSHRERMGCPWKSHCRSTTPFMDPTGIKISASGRVGVTTSIVDQ